MSDEVFLEGVGWVPQAEANEAATKMQARYRGKAERKATAEKKQKQKEAKEEAAAATKVHKSAMEGGRKCVTVCVKRSLLSRWLVSIQCSVL